MRRCLCATGEPFVPDRVQETRSPEPGAALEEAVRAASRSGFRCLELSVEALEDYLAVYPLVVLDAFLAEQRCHIGVISDLTLDMEPALQSTEGALFRARFLEICTDLDGLGGGIVALAGITGESHLPALQTLSALAQPYEVQIAVECDDAGHDGRLPLAKATALLQSARCTNAGLAYTVSQAAPSLSQLAMLDDLSARLLLLRCHVGGDAPGIQEILKGRRGLCSIKPPAGLGPLEAARAAAEVAASLETPTWKGSPNRQT